MQNYARSRNSDCRITTNLFIGEIETVILENDLIRMTILVGRGADVVEYLYKPRDLDLIWLTNKGIPTKKVLDSYPADVDTFLNGYPGGWQSIFPNGGAPSKVGEINFAQHDEVALLPWNYTIVADNPGEISIELFVETKKVPFRFTKKFTLKKNEKKCLIQETAQNLGGSKFQAMWGAHFSFGSPIFGPGSKIKLPKGGRVIAHQAPISVTGRRVGSIDTFDWPIGKSNSGSDIDFSSLPPEKTESEMLYIEKLSEGWYQIESANNKIGARVSWDLNLMPYLWFWQEFGSNNSYPWFGKHYNIGLEPFSSYPTNGLNEAIGNGTALSFNSGELKKSNIEFEVVEL